jgi:pimeloyl-ACP methyl ester carboxylesterase
MIHPQGAAAQTDIVLFEQGTSEMPAQSARLHRLLAANHRLLVFDVRGVGAVKTRTVNADQPPHDTEFKLGCDAMMLKGSTLGMRVFDLLRAVDYLRSRDDVERIGLVGVDSGAIFAYLAAALEPEIAELTCENLLFSYRDLVFTRFYDHQRYNLKTLAWGLLPQFDLVDLLPCLAPRPCTFHALRNAQGEIQAGEALLEVAAKQSYLPPNWLPAFS